MGAPCCQTACAPCSAASASRPRPGTGTSATGTRQRQGAHPRGQVRGQYTCGLRQILSSPHLAAPASPSRPAAGTSAGRQRCTGPPHSITHNPHPTPASALAVPLLLVHAGRQAEGHHTSGRALPNPAPHLLPVQAPQDLALQENSEALVQPKVLPSGIGHKVAWQDGGRASGGGGTI